MQDIISDLQQKQYLTINHLKSSEIWPSVPSSMVMMKPRQILFHLQHEMTNVPTCQCGDALKWHDDKREYRIYCSRSCSAAFSVEKAKMTNLRKYGVEYYSQTDEWQDKRKDTSIKKFGVDHYSKSETFTRSVIDTNNEKYGVDYPSQNIDIQAKITETYMTNYGVAHPWLLDNYKEQIQETNMNLYGTIYPTQNVDVKTKTKITNNEKYGVDFPMQNKDILSSAQATNLGRYGNICSAQSDDIRAQIKKTYFDECGVHHQKQRHFDDGTYYILSDPTRFEQYVTGKYTADIAAGLGIDPTTIRSYLHKYNLWDAVITNSSYFEEQVINFLDSEGLSYSRHNRQLIAPLEIDIYLEDFKLGIECNGDYWHSDKFKSHEYHKNKWDLCRKQNIHLVQIYECDWDFHKNKIKELLRSLTATADKGVGARKCSIRKITGKDARLFQDNYHLQNFVAGSHFGAYHNDTLVGTMTFGWTRGNKTSRRFELKRWVTDNKTHPGLFSKVFKYAQKCLGFDEVVSFSMNDWFTGNLYAANGFKLNSITAPSYFYVVNNKRTHCSLFTKDRIKQKLPHVFDSSLTEREMMSSAGILRCYDSGKQEWVWKSVDFQ